MKLLRAVPALPVSRVEMSMEFFRDRPGFSVAHLESGFAILKRDAVEIKIWTAR